MLEVDCADDEDFVELLFDFVVVAGAGCAGEFEVLLCADDVVLSVVEGSEVVPLAAMALSSFGGL